MKMMNRKMESICRGVVSTIAGVDNETLTAVLNMRMRSAGVNAEDGANMVKTILMDQAKAVEDFAY